MVNNGHALNYFSIFVCKIHCNTFYNFYQEPNTKTVQTRTLAMALYPLVLIHLIEESISYEYDTSITSYGWHIQTLILVLFIKICRTSRSIYFYILWLAYSLILVLFIKICRTEMYKYRLLPF